MPRHLFRLFDWDNTDWTVAKPAWDYPVGSYNYYPWSDMHTGDGAYDFSKFDNDLAECAARPAYGGARRLLLAAICVYEGYDKTYGPNMRDHTPLWLKNLTGGSYRLAGPADVYNGLSYIWVPRYDNGVWQAKLLEFMAALGDHFYTHPNKAYLAGFKFAVGVDIESQPVKDYSAGYWVGAKQTDSDCLGVDWTVRLPGDLFDGHDDMMVRTMDTLVQHLPDKPIFVQNAPGGTYNRVHTWIHAKDNGYGMSCNGSQTDMMGSMSWPDGRKVLTNGEDYTKVRAGTWDAYRWANMENQETGVPAPYICCETTGVGMGSVEPWLEFAAWTMFQMLHFHPKAVDWHSGGLDGVYNTGLGRWFVSHIDRPPETAPSAWIVLRDADRPDPTKAPHYKTSWPQGGITVADAGHVSVPSDPDKPQSGNWEYFLTQDLNVMPVNGAVRKFREEITDCPSGYRGRQCRLVKAAQFNLHPRFAGTAATAFTVSVVFLNRSSGSFTLLPSLNSTVGEVVALGPSLGAVNTWISYSFPVTGRTFAIKSDAGVHVHMIVARAGSLTLGAGSADLSTWQTWPIDADEDPEPPDPEPPDPPPTVLKNAKVYALPDYGDRPEMIPQFWPANPVSDEDWRTWAVDELGSVLLYTWDQIHLGPGEYNWSLIHNHLAALEGRSAQICITFATSTETLFGSGYQTLMDKTPPWIYDSGLVRADPRGRQSLSGVYSRRVGVYLTSMGRIATAPPYNNATWRGVLKDFLVALAAEFGSNEQVKAFSLGLGIDGKCQPTTLIDGIDWAAVWNLDDDLTPEEADAGLQPRAMHYWYWGYSGGGNRSACDFFAERAALAFGGNKWKVYLSVDSLAAAEKSVWMLPYTYGLGMLSSDLLPDSPNYTGYVGNVGTGYGFENALGSDTAPSIWMQTASKNLTKEQAYWSTYRAAHHFKKLQGTNIHSDYETPGGWGVFEKFDQGWEDAYSERVGKTHLDSAASVGVPGSPAHGSLKYGWLVLRDMEYGVTGGYSGKVGDWEGCVRIIKDEPGVVFNAPQVLRADMQTIYESLGGTYTGPSYAPGIDTSAVVARQTRQVNDVTIEVDRLWMAGALPPPDLSTLPPWALSLGCYDIMITFNHRPGKTFQLEDLTGGGFWGDYYIYETTCNIGFHPFPGPGPADGGKWVSYIQTWYPDLRNLDTKMRFRITDPSGTQDLYIHSIFIYPSVTFALFPRAYVPNDSRFVFWSNAY